MTEGSASMRRLRRAMSTMRERLHILDARAPGDATQTVIARLGRLEASTLASWGTMSAGGMVCHLTDTFRIMYGERSLTLADTLHTRRGIRRSVVKWIALYVPVRWPHGLRTLSQVDQDRDGTTPGDFERDRVELVGFIERVAGGDLPSDLEHPYLGRLSAWEWRRWAYVHVDHHARQFRL